MNRRPRLSLDDYERGALAGDRTVLAQAITLVESQDAADAALAQDLLTRLMPRTGGARRVAVSGPPGVGKSTFIDALGMRLLARGHKVAVLAVDPSSSVTGGSILGDKTRMADLSLAPAAFIRPTPSGLTPGGVARRTREALLLCEAAGFDIVLVETVGVGQSETAVADMVDFFLLLALPGAGDELQGIKRGILELCDAVAVTKADGDNLQRARLARKQLQSALHYAGAREGRGEPITTCVSSVSGDGLDELWTAIEQQLAARVASGELATRRQAQSVRWMWSLVGEQLDAAFRRHPQVAAALPALEAEVRAGRVSATDAARRLLAAFGHAPLGD